MPGGPRGPALRTLPRVPRGGPAGEAPPPAAHTAELALLDFPYF